MKTEHGGMRIVDLIWNRAALDHGGASPRAGDLALSALLLAHGLTMNGGVPHAWDVLTDAEREASAFGYRFFGFDDVATLIASPEEVVDDETEERLNQAYWDAIPDDASIARRFEAHFALHPELYAPV